MKYEGLIGKVANAIPNSSAKKFAAIGAGVVAPIGMGLSYYNNQDVGDAAIGGLRSAAFGGIMGLAAHKVPGMVASQIKKSGIDIIDSQELRNAAELGSDIFKPFLGRINTQENKELLKTFNPHVKSALKHSGDNVKFSKTLIKGMDETSDNLKPETFTNLMNLGEEVVTGVEKFDASSSGRYLADYAENVSTQWKGLSFYSKAKNVAAFGTKMGFDSAYGHIVKPAGNFLKGKFTTENTAAFGFSVYGAYEAGIAVNNVQQGDYSGAAKAMGMIVGGKLLYGQAANLVHFNSFLKSKDLGWGQVAKGAASGYGLSKFTSGARKFTQDEMGAVQGVFKNTGAARQPYRDVLYRGL